VRGSPVSFPSYNQYSTDQLIGLFTKGPGCLGAAIAGLTEEDLRARARGPQAWLAHEIVIHTADSEIQGAYRLRKVWAQPGCDLPSDDQDAWARELDCLGGDTCADRERALELLAPPRADSAHSRTPW
jgi:hypothetical protein